MPTATVPERFEGPKAMSTESPTTGLEKAAERTPAIITTPDEYRGALLRWQAQHYTILSPFTNISAVAPQHGLITSLVQISPNKDDGDVYDNSGGIPFLKDHEVALAKPGLRKIAECAGISTSTIRTDPRTIAHYWEFKAIGRYRSVDGSIIQREATMEWDLRDGSDRLKGFKPNQITEARKNGLRNCETRAVSAVIRECGCGLKQKYTKAELAKPFVVVRVLFMPDMTDPETRRLVTERALGGTTAMYPTAARHLPSHGSDYIDAEPADPPVSGSTGTSSPTSSPAASTTTTPNPDAPPTPDAVRIVKVEIKEGETGGRKWTRYSITDSSGADHSTFDKTIADVAAKAVQSRAWVEIAEESDGQYKNLIEIMPAGQQPSLLPDPSAL